MIPKKKKWKKAKWLFEKASQIAEKRREVKSKEKRKDQFSSVQSLSRVRFFVTP